MLEVNLYTITHQMLPVMGIFIVLIVIMRFLLFRPMMRLMEVREEKTIGETGRAADMADQTRENLEEYNRRIGDAEADMELKRKDIEQESIINGKEILTDVRKEIAERMKEARESVEKETLKAKEDLNQTAYEMSRWITKTILGREIGDGSDS